MNESIFKDCWAPTEAGNILTINCIPVLVGNLILWALIFSGVIALIFIIFSGIKFITSGGDPKQVEGARKTLTFALAGLVLILLSFAILRFFSDVTKLGCIREFGFKQCDDSVQIIEPERPQTERTIYNELGDKGPRDSLNCNLDTTLMACPPPPNDYTGECECVPKSWPLCNVPLLGRCGPGRICTPNNPGSNACPCTCKKSE